MDNWGDLAASLLDVVYEAVDLQLFEQINGREVVGRAGRLVDRDELALT